MVALAGGAGQKQRALRPATRAKARAGGGPSDGRASGRGGGGRFAADTGRTQRGQDEGGQAPRLEVMAGVLCPIRTFLLNLPSARFR